MPWHTAVFDDLILVGVSADPTQHPGLGTQIVYARTAQLKLHRVTLRAGDGAPGSAGARGGDAPALGAQGSMNGGNGGSNDKYGISLDTGYMSGLQPLQGGNVTIH